MQDSGVIAGLDAQLVHALQIAPRASWQTLAPVLGIDPVTAARRWKGLQGAGLAWVTGYPGRRLIERLCTAFVEVDCRAGSVESVADTLVVLPQVATVEHMAGGRDLLITVFVPGLGELSELLLRRIAALPGVTSTRASIGTRLYGEGSRWRLRALTTLQSERLRLTSPPPRTGSPAGLDGPDRALLPELSRNGRENAVELGRAVGLSAPTVRRRVGRLVADHDLALRCEVARELTEWPVSATLWAGIPADRLPEAVRVLLTLPEVRLCASVTGPQNLLFTVWLHSIQDVQRLETQLGERLPQLRLKDRSIVLRQTKLMGRLLDGRGRAAGAVPVDPWAPVMPVAP
ncbi:Lrp/AsnC family transcriptional regulator [Streptomyces sp. NBC_01023]|uniref:Lrp/AsnC family transcriptional regulator n=1 Tax=Streptomyces sp. NBC_01023 TaxID=2903724 RepID=UPI003863A796|nr:Lrp/AsnC family transcriptional regulator [Streptomyces sp. NBC_01023]